MSIVLEEDGEEEEVDEVTSLPPFALPELLAVVVVVLEKEATVELVATEEVDRVVVVSFPAFEIEETPLIPLPLSVAELWAAVVVESDVPLPFTLAELVEDSEVDVEEATDEALLSIAPGPAATALAAKAAAAIPLAPSLEAAFTVVPFPITVNLVQSSLEPRWATGIKTG